MIALREARIRKLLTVRGLAKLADISPVTLQDIEAGRRTPQPGTLRKLAAALELDPGEGAEFRRAIEGAIEGKDAA